jgi:hypothetical protein
MFEGYAFGYGEEAEFSDDEISWYKRPYIGYIDGGMFPYISVDANYIQHFKTGKKFCIETWKYTRLVRKTCKIIIDDEEIEISEESYKILKESLLQMNIVNF